MPLERFGRIVDASATPPDEIAEAVAGVVFSGGTVIFPNDTSYLLGCDPYDYEAIDRVYAAMGRPDNRPLTMHVATAHEFLEYAADNPLAIHAAKRLLPAPVILLIRKPLFVSDELAAGLQTLAFRVPDDRVRAPRARAMRTDCRDNGESTRRPQVSRRRGSVDASNGRSSGGARTDAL